MNVPSVSVLALALACIPQAFAQMNPIPPSSTLDGIVVRGMGPNAGSSHWESTSSLGAYRFASDDNLGTPNMGSPDNVLGLSWNSSRPAAVSAALNRVDSYGAYLRVIFLGESAGWRNDFGYTYTGDPLEDSYTLFRDINAQGPEASLHFGDYVDIPLIPGDGQVFDLWFNAVGGDGRPAAPTENGGTYTVFHPEQSTPYLSPGNVLWAQTPLLANTWMPTLARYENIDTYLVGMEDWRRDRGADNDSNDFLFGLQFIYPDFRPIDWAQAAVDPAPVPEPATFAAAGVLMISGLMLRRFWQRAPRGTAEALPRCRQPERPKARNCG